MGRQRHAGLHNQFHGVAKDQDSYKEQQRTSRPMEETPRFSNCEKRHKRTETYDGDDQDGNCNSPIGRLDVWSDHHTSSSDTENHNPREKFESLPSSRRVRHRSESLLYQGNGTITRTSAIPPPLDILKKRTSAGQIHSTYYDDQQNSTRGVLQRRHQSLSGSAHDLKGSCGDISSPKAFGSGTLFGASLGFLGSSGSLTDIHAKMWSVRSVIILTIIKSTCVYYNACSSVCPWTHPCYHKNATVYLIARSHIWLFIVK